MEQSKNIKPRAVRQSFFLCCRLVVLTSHWFTLKILYLQGKGEYEHGDARKGKRVLEESQRVPVLVCAILQRRSADTGKHANHGESGSTRSAAPSNGRYRAGSTSADGRAQEIGRASCRERVWHA